MYVDNWGEEVVFMRRLITVAAMLAALVAGSAHNPAAQSTERVAQPASALCGGDCDWFM